MTAESTGTSTHEPAVYLAQGESITLVWANDRYLDLLDEPYRSEGVAGQHLRDISVIGATREAALVGVMRTGDPISGEDRGFSVEGGMTVFSWHAYRPLPDHVLVTICIR